MNSKTTVYEFGEFRVDVIRRSLQRNGQIVPVSGKAFEILLVLLEQRGEPVDKNALMQQVWRDTVVEDNNITVAVSALRKALGDSPANPKWLITIPGRGYCFVGEVRRESSGFSREPARTIPVPEQTLPRRRWRTVDFLMIGAILLALLAYGLVAWLTPKRLGPKSVAILPFTVLNQDSQNDYLGLGLTDALITRLGSTQLVITPLATVSRFAKRDPIQSGRDLGVDAVVEGTVQSADNSIRVSVRLLRVRDSKPLWSQIFEVPSENAFSLEDSIADQVATNLLGSLTSQQQTALNKGSTTNAAAYANYLRGRYYAANDYTQDGYQKAVLYLQTAIDEDPEYALAYSGLADTYYDTSNLIYPPSEAMPRAKAAAERAVALDPSLAAAHVSLGLIASKYDWNWDVAEREFQTALTLDPNLATAHLWFGVYRAQRGDFDRAISEVHRAQELDPLSGEINSYLGLVLYWARRYDESINQLRQAIAFDPTFVPNYVGLCWALAAKSETKAALEACKQSSKREAIPWTTLALARAQALTGDRATAAATLVSFASQSSVFVSGYDKAAVYVALGRTDEALLSKKVTNPTRNGCRTSR